MISGQWGKRRISKAPGMDIFNPNILDACIRDVASGLTDNQKVDLLLYSAPSVRIDSYTRVIVENAMHSCLQTPNLNPEKIAKARILRARSRLAAGLQFSANEDLQAALAAEPDNPEARALLYHRSVTVEKLLSPLPRSKERLSNEIWTEIVSYLPRKDLKSLLFVPHVVSRVASELLFKRLDLYLTALSNVGDHEHSFGHFSPSVEEDVRHASRSANILTHILVNSKFGAGVRTLRIYAPAHDKDGAIAFQSGILTNTLPKLSNLQEVCIFAGRAYIVSLLQVLHVTNPRLKSISLCSSDAPADLSFTTFKHLTHFSYHTEGGSQSSISKLMAQNHTSLRTFSIKNSSWTFPSSALAIRNFVYIDFTGHLPVNCQALVDILTHGRQLESLALSFSIDCPLSSQTFRSMPKALPFLRHFAFTVHGASSRIRDPDLFPAIADFLRGRSQLHRVALVVCDSNIQPAFGFNAAIWGILPTLLNLRALEMTYPSDLSPGLAAWLIPRSVRALTLTLDYSDTPISNYMRSPTTFLEQLRPGIPPELRYVRLTQIPVRDVALIVEHGFPMVRVLHVGNDYWTVRTDPAENDTQLEIEQWPRSRAAFNAPEWLEWLGCNDAIAGIPNAMYPV